ncbi:argininosuccinate lyase [Oribacterium sp. WCC10]|uniref:argininosuccinate lyase n=1 Tax=Oribacterium sp. WCC10 TaxID=1855343 RepID=UPI0008EF81F0|nr:argininosuccinate lyase [Oribacterium sp. WCC10]SFG19574.1 argininosuccinate lyase [Oribacterium sp. WCC10]
MKLWGGRFTEAEDALTEAFNESLSFDKRMYKQDIRGSVAHATMLGKQGIISSEDSEKIVKGLESILQDIEDGKLEIGGDAEDIHSFVEAELTERIGEAGKRLHTGRSRNDQVALDMKMYTRDHLDDTITEIEKLIDTFERIIDENRDTYMPGFTHLQKAQPTTLAHHMGAYREMFMRDLSRLGDTRDRLNECPLGAGAFAGTTYPLDRDFTARELGFRKPTNNSMDSVSDRDYLLEYVFDLSTIQMHLSRLSEEIIIWNSNEYQFVKISDAYSTGSSIMPQKKNPDIAELIRGKTGRVYGDLNSLMVVMKGLPLAYNKDMQEDKESAFDAMDTVKNSVILMNGMLSTMTWNRERMNESAKLGFTNATDVADYLVRKGVPFRTAHGIVGELVLLCEKKKCALDDLTLSEYREICDKIDEDIYTSISLECCVKNRRTKGAPGELL